MITGEGRLDAQTLEGKAISEIARRCARAGVPASRDRRLSRSTPPSAEQLALASVRQASDLAELESAGRALATAACST